MSLKKIEKLPKTAGYKRFLMRWRRLVSNSVKACWCQLQASIEASIALTNQL
jgi:hypothetical protein